MDDLDRRLIAMVSAHSFVTAIQVGQYMALEPAEVALRVDRLCAARLLRRERLIASADPVLRVTPAGLVAIGSRLEAPGFAPVDVRHGLAAVAMWMAGWSGALGEPGRVLSRREMEGLDRAAAGSAGVATGFQVQITGVDRYPDLALLPPSGVGWTSDQAAPEEHRQSRNTGHHDPSHA
jgi:hypothetical protein